MNGNDVPLEGDEKYIAGIQQMDAWELLSEVITNPEYLMDRYYSSFGYAIRERFEELQKERGE